jgi:NTE family protein
MAGFQFGERVVPNFWKINSGMDIRLSSRVFLSFNANIAHTAEKVDRMYSSLLDTPWDDYLKGYAAGLRFNSVLGPLTLMVGDNNTDNNLRWYVNLGYTF